MRPPSPLRRPTGAHFADRPRRRSRSRLTTLAGVALVAATIVAVASEPSSTDDFSVAVAPTADAFVRATEPDTNFGDRSALRADGSPVMLAYVRFDLPSAAVSARLHLFANSTLHAPLTISVAASNGWAENAITYNNAPAFGTPVGEVPSVEEGQWFDIDVTAAASEAGAVTLVLATGGETAVNIASRDDATHAPQLLLITAPIETTSTTTPEATTTPDATTTPEATTTSEETTTTTALSADVSVPADASDPVVMAAGDIACDPSSGDFNGGLGSAGSCHQLAVSDLIVADPTVDAVLTLGDHQYDSGTYDQFTTSYDPSWGRAKPMTHPAVGNHEYLTSGAAAYFDYFGAAAGERSKGYYSFDLGTWHIVALNSNCSHAGGCGAGSPQEQWLRADLAEHPAACTAAYWHHPRYSSGEHGSTASVEPLWQALYDNGADLVLSGHDHDYERFAPQNGSSERDDARGIRQFVVGTGGKNHYAFSSVQPNSEVRDSSTYGVLRLQLHPGSYDWTFVPEPGGTFTDAGSTACH